MFATDSFLLSIIFKIVLGVLALVLAIALILFVRFILNPLLGMNYYRKQGARCYFYPMAGLFHRYFKDSLEQGDFYYSAKRGARDNPDRIFCTNLATKPYLILHDTTLIKEFFLKNDYYVKEPLHLDFFVDLLGVGLALVEGNEWKIQKKMLSSNFHFEFLNAVLPTVQKLAYQRLINLQKGDLKTVDIMAHMQDISGEIVGKLFFGEELADYTFEGKPLTKALADLMVECFSANMTHERYVLGTFIAKFLPTHKRMLNRIYDFRNTCVKFVEQRQKEVEQNKGKKDMVQLLLEWEGENGKITPMNIVDQFVSFFLPGIDTSGQLLTMCIYYMTKHPEWKERIYEEVTRMYSSQRPIPIEELNKFEVLTAFFKEVLRTTTPINDLFARKALKSHMIGDIHVKEGDVVNVEFLYNNYNPKFFEDPDRFDPNRWLKKGTGLDSYAFTPFSAGPRNCIGQHLATNQIKVILCELMTMYDFEIRADYKLIMTFQFVYGPLEPIPLTLIPRKKNN